MSAITGLVEVVLVVEDLQRSLRVGPPRDGIPQQVVLVPRLT